MSDVFYLRSLEPPVAPDDIPGMFRLASSCFELHRIDWRHSFLALDGGRMLCWYNAPDAESARLALRQLGSDMNAVWAGTVLGLEPPPPIEQANVVAEVQPGRRLPEHRLRSAAEQCTGEDCALIRGFVSSDRRRLVAVFRAAAEESARAALAAVGLPTRLLWGCRPVTPQRLLC